MRVELHGKIPVFFFLALALLLLWSPAAAKIIVEPGPPELPTDVTYIDDERFVPLWHYSPLEFLTIVLLIHCPLLAMPFELVYSAGVLAFLGYQSSRRPLDHKKRSRIYACIRDHPGITPVEIARATGINRGTTGYHLSRLREAGLVSVIHQDGRVGYFRNRGYDTTEKNVYFHLRNSVRQQILTLLLDDPGITQSEIADDTGISRSAAAWHLQRLAADGLIESDRDGRTVRYALTDEALVVFGILEDAAAGGVTPWSWSGASAGSRADSAPW
ncbi:winged helix-turn-helix transcriptional regulator [Methanoculleus sp. 7T]|uniref:winged helix-turn-helix transcriptional regulator n=1 Tax=Methanoculleus sp. 7T TaxID=2937282 RepID=UPI0020BF40C6|nr:winged helix-turn-helix transcriptional regulator [Methanoculleus sp. 7T]MCK8518078.1 winged helix-turn-helix transcriptional regulator [Methanoculleus sp. 7T]